MVAWVSEPVQQRSGGDLFPCFPDRKEELMECDWTGVSLYGLPDLVYNVESDFQAAESSLFLS